METHRSNVGVIVGRFQVDDLHAGHIDLIESVKKHNDRVIIFLGLSPLKATSNNPLDFAARQVMITEKFPDVQVLYIKDVPCDKLWSKKLDEQIGDLVGPAAKVTLYGSRDAFISHYTGKYTVLELRQEIYISGSEIRDKIANTTPKTRDFRAGVIWATKNQFINPKCTVDVAVYDKKNHKVLLARKPNETLYRFPGGFINPMETAEHAACRELFEETCLDIGGVNQLKFLGSHVINDWRYRSEKENVLTFFYLVEYLYGRPEPKDDICELKWFAITDLEAMKKCVVETHHCLLETFYNKIAVK